MTPFRPLYLDAGGEPFLALLHDAVGRGPAILLFAPFGWEDITSYRSRFEWAESLAEGGMPTLRFDLPGTGDSAGSPGDAGRLESWIAAAGVAGRFLRSETGRPRVVALGIGLGGLLALAAAADGAPIDDFVLWGVPAGGKTLVRELTAFAGIESGLIVAGGSPEPPPLPSGAIAPGGFVLPGATLRSLEGLDVADLDLPSSETRRALLLDRDGIPPARALVQKLRDCGVQVDLADGHGYGEMLTKTPEATRLPHAVRDRVRDWLAAGTADAVPVTRSVSAPPPPSPPTSSYMELSVGPARIRERPFLVDHDGGRLFGILAEGVGVPPRGPALVLLNAGAIRRVGPSRLWVEFARRWAARGVPTLRLDLRAIGDASGDAHRYVDVAGLYAQEYVGQVRAALDRLAEAGAAPRFVLFGLCSGAYWAFHTALADDRVSLAVMLNPRLLFWEHGQPVTAERRARELRSSVFRLGAWRRALQGDRRLAARRLLAFARLIATDPIRRRARARAHDVTRAATEQAFDRLAGGDARGIFLFTDGEPLFDELEAAGTVARPDRWPRLEFVNLPGRDHILRPLWMHAHLQGELDRALAAELRGLADPAVAVQPSA